MVGNKPSIWFVCSRFGTTSQAWLWRQVCNMQRVNVRVVTWERENVEAYPLAANQLHVLPFETHPYDGGARWLQRVINLPTGNFFGTIGAERRELFRLIEQDRPAVILAHFGHCAVHVLPVAKRYNVPIVVHFHGLDLSSSLKANRWYRWSLMASLDDFAEKIVVGAHQEKLLIDHGVPRDGVHLIPCGAATDDFTARDDFTSDTVRFVAASRLVRQKGVAESIRAFAKVSVECRDCSLELLGEGPLARELEDLVAHFSLRDRVTFHGWQVGSQYKALIRSSDIFLQHSIPSYDQSVEGFGVGIAEASSCELPVVATRVGGIPDQIIDGHNGFLVEPGDVEGMAAAMLRLARNKELRQRMGKAGRERVVEHYDSRGQAHRLEDVLLRVAAESHPTYCCGNGA